MQCALNLIYIYSKTIDVPIRKESLKKFLKVINFIAIKFDINN